MLVHPIAKPKHQYGLEMITHRIDDRLTYARYNRSPCNPDSHTQTHPIRAKTISVLLSLSCPGTKNTHLGPLIPRCHTTRRNRMSHTEVDPFGGFHLGACFTGADGEEGGEEGG